MTLQQIQEALAEQQAKALEQAQEVAQAIQEAQDTGMSMVDGETVLVRLHSDPEWYKGVVVKERKQWVELDHDGPTEGIIVGEGDIAEWKRP